MPNPLNDLSLRYCPSKALTELGYVEGYWAAFSELRDEKLRFLEIGVAGGSSMKMWAEFFPNAQIFGVDRSPEAAQYADDRTRIFIGDQMDAEFLERVCDEAGGFDVIIDDGGHHPEQVATSLRVLFPRLAPGGIYAIEDMYTAYSPRFGPYAGLGNPGNHVELLKSALDVLFAHPDFGGAVGDDVSSRIASTRFYPGLALLYKSRSEDSGAGIGPSDLRVARPQNALGAPRARLRVAGYRLRKNARRIARKLRRPR